MKKTQVKNLVNGSNKPEFLKCMWCQQSLFLGDIINANEILKDLFLSTQNYTEEIAQFNFENADQGLVFFCKVNYGTPPRKPQFMCPHCCMNSKDILYENHRSGCSTCSKAENTVPLTPAAYLVEAMSRIESEDDDDEEEDSASQTFSISHSSEFTFDFSSDDSSDEESDSSFQGTHVNTFSLKKIS